MTRRVCYEVAASLDGCIAGPKGEFDWIPDDPTVDFESLIGRFDTFLLGRATYELVISQEHPPWPKGSRLFTFSRTLTAVAEGYSLVRDDAAAVVARLRAEPAGRDIWLFGGGGLFGSLLAAGQVDDVEVVVCPMLLGGGIPLLPPIAVRTALRLDHSHVYPSGMVRLRYSVANAREAS